MVTATQRDSRRRAAAAEVRHAALPPSTLEGAMRPKLLPSDRIDQSPACDTEALLWPVSWASTDGCVLAPGRCLIQPRRTPIAGPSLSFE